ncbi:hypothetical protein LR48_Vigan01g065400 [Vigna angularis]|uniref:Uncharacterized protein n=1 Tax=Phaseolus angularis TaxID=3914 RepID=A0A0L9TLR8_PHAAN|nr:hypothetical protein LR48_Vigan01g065400 [Vigna angularis]
MKQLPFMVVVCTVMLFVVYRTLKYQYYEEEIDKRWSFLGEQEAYPGTSGNLKGLPRGIIQDTSDFELRPLWSPSSLRSKVSVYSNRHLLAIPVVVDELGDALDLGSVTIAWLCISFQSVAFLCMEITVLLLLWFAKRFLHPDIVSIYDYIFLWDEDLGVEHFSPSRYIEIVKEEGLEISQPALDPDSGQIHHKITVRARTKKVHRRVYELRGNTRCSEASTGPPCTGFVEGMAPVFSRSAWDCTWHLIQNDLVHGWGLDMKIGYCAQGDRTQNVGVVDEEYVVHKGIPSLGGSGDETAKRHGASVFDERIELLANDLVYTNMSDQIRRQSTWEFEVFKRRWNKAIAADKNWVDPFTSDRKRLRHRKKKNHFS